MQDMCYICVFISAEASSDFRLQTSLHTDSQSFIIMTDNVKTAKIYQRLKLVEAVWSFYSVIMLQ